MVLHNDFWHAIFRPLPLMAEYKNRPRMTLSVVIVTLVCVLNTVAAPIANVIANGGSYVGSFSVWERLGVLAVSLGSFMVACLLFWLLAAVFHKNVEFKEIVSTWGISFIPNILCIAAVEASEAGYYLFMGNAWLGLILCTFLVLLLAWKAIYFFMETGVTLGLKGGQTVGAVVITGIVYVIIMWAGFRLGVKVPIL